MQDSSVELFTVEEVATRFRVKPRTVYRWLKSGVMEGIRTPGGQHRITGEAVRQEFERRVVNEPEPVVPDVSRCRPENGYHATPHSGCPLR